MAHHRKTSGGLIEIIRSRKEKEEALLRGIVGGLGELIEVIKDQEERLAKLEGKPREKPLTLKLEKKLQTFNTGRVGRKKK